MCVTIMLLFSYQLLQFKIDVVLLKFALESFIAFVALVSAGKKKLVSLIRTGKLKCMIIKFF